MLSANLRVLGKYGGYQTSGRTPRTLDLGNYGVVVYFGPAGFLISAVCGLM